MERLDAITEGFKVKLEKFLFSCETQEELGAWDAEEYGDMDVFFQNHLLVFILRLVAADGNISEKEAEYVNKNFGFTYTAEELAAVCEDCREVLGESYDAQCRMDIANLRAIHENLVLQYTDLVETLCSIIMQSDGSVVSAEIEEAQRIRELVQSIS